MKKTIYKLTIILLALNVEAQSDMSDFVGHYGDWMPNGEALMTDLELKADGTFKLRSVDNIYPQTFNVYTNEGRWIIKNEQIILNPTLEKREPRISLIEKEIGLKDSIEIKVNHFIEFYENEELIETKETEFDLLTIYFNKRQKYKHLTRKWMKEGSCAFAPRIRNRINLDSTNTFRITKKDIERIGVYTYGFINFRELKIKNRKSDYLEITVIVPIDKERMPRDKKVIIKRNRAYFYEVKGRVKKSLTPLRKKTV